jgi:hypothetical protein
MPLKQNKKTRRNVVSEYDLSKVLIPGTTSYLPVPKKAILLRKSVY